jgi:hypothetical protein
VAPDGQRFLVLPFAFSNTVTAASSRPNMYSALTVVTN